MYNEDDLYNENSSNNKGLIIKILIIIAFICGLGFLLFRYFTTNIETNPRNNCAVDEQGRIITNGKTTFLIDLTDPLSNLQKSYVKDSIMQEISRLPYGNFVTIYFLDAESNKDTPPYFQKCKLKNVEDSSSAVEDTTQLKLQNKKFLSEVANLLDNRMTIKEAQNSPILDIMQAVAQNPFFKYRFSDERFADYYKAIGATAVKPELKLLIYSDMLHYTKSFSMYSKSYSYLTFKELPYSLERKVHLPDVHVYLHYLVNNSKFQNLRNTKFWEDYFLDAGGRLYSTHVVGK